MLIDRLALQNFKGIERRSFSFHPEFNLIVGDNGLGKTSLLEALSIAAGTWFLGFKGYSTRHIRSEEVRLQGFSNENGIHWEYQYPCVVDVAGNISGKDLRWKRALNSPDGRTTYMDSRSVKELATEYDAKIRSGEPINLPLISYYGTGRLWNAPREQAKITSTKRMIKDKKAQSRLIAYQNAIDPRLSVSGLVEWIAQESWKAFQNQGTESALFRVTRAALIRNVKDAQDVFFDAKYGEVVVEFQNGNKQPFNKLSDGQRCMLALVGDLAYQAATLNPHLGDQVLLQTSGIVMIDELDLHLHPKWQRHVIEDLRKTFPKLQFFCSTHSPVLIQSLRSGEELLMLEGQPVANLGDLPLDKIVQGIQGVSEPEVSERYLEMKRVAHDYMGKLEAIKKIPQDARIEPRAQLSSLIAPYADNPAFQAFLEMKRIAELGD